jgi:hypothetical protein
MSRRSFFKLFLTCAERNRAAEQTDAEQSRALILRNSMNLPRKQSGDTVDPIGIDLSGFDEAICRNSLIAADPDDPNAADTTNTMVGIRFTSIGAVTVVSNVISECTEQNSVVYLNCGTVASFNNEAPDGTLLHAYDATAAARLMELQDSAEDLVLGI